MNYCKIVCCLLLFTHLAKAQEQCQGAQKFDFLYSNNISARIDPSGSLFFDGQAPGLKITENANQLPQQSIIFSHSLWLGAIVLEDTIIAAADFGKATGDFDYYPGPIWAGNPNFPGGPLEDPERGTLNNISCRNWDQVWTVFRTEIDRYLEDWTDNNIIDANHPSIFAWPGLGNAQFEEANGFTLPVDASENFAPFFDQNGNGIYEPLEGDYPMIEQSNLIPDQISWCVMNDIGGPHSESGSIGQLQVEVQITSWSFNCSDNPVLQQTVFNSFKIINKGTETLTNFKGGLWTDFDLGCFRGDLLGCSPDQNCYFVYEKENVDLQECFEFIGFGDNPPVASVILLNQDLESFNYINNSIPPNFPPDATTSPTNATDYFNYLNGKFKDGTSITANGIGYQTNGEETKYAFSDNPNDSEGWSMLQDSMPYLDFMGLGNFEIGNLNPDQFLTVDVAYGFHREDDNNHLENVDLMYEEVATIQSFYDNQFENQCDERADLCLEDCVWAGDLNADGIANHLDLLEIGYSWENSGLNRSGPYNWGPQVGENWNNQQILSSQDEKHLDANGDGIIDYSDFDLTQTHWQFTQPGYEAIEAEYNEGTDLILESVFGSLSDLTPGESRLSNIRLTTDLSNLKALAFELEFDTAYMLPPVIISGPSGTDEQLSYLNTEKTGDIHTAKIVLKEDASTGEEFFSFLSVIRVEVKEELPNQMAFDSTCIRFRNIKAYDFEGVPIDLGGNTIKIYFNQLVETKNPPLLTSNLNIFPNPANETLYIDSNGKDFEQVQIFDGRGALVLENSGHQNQIDISMLDAGIYYLKVKQKDQINTLKFIKQ